MPHHASSDNRPAKSTAPPRIAATTKSGDYLITARSFVITDA
jgi:hypothetical protein